MKSCEIFIAVCHQVALAMCDNKKQAHTPEIEMRTIKLPIDKIINWYKNPIGKSICFPVKVGWKELQLTKNEILANAVARASDKPEPYPDNSIFCIEVTTEGLGLFPRRRDV